MEACGTSHHWARELVGLGHEVRLMHETGRDGPAGPYVRTAAFDDDFLQSGHSAFGRFR
jgi:hypothetical protein